MLLAESAETVLQRAASTADPTETGGLLLGSWSRQRPCVTHVLVVPHAQPRLAHYFLPAGLTHPLISCARRVDRGLGYLGEWHVHPVDTGPSRTDRRPCADSRHGSPSRPSCFWPDSSRGATTSRPTCGLMSAAASSRSSGPWTCQGIHEVTPASCRCGLPAPHVGSASPDLEAASRRSLVPPMRHPGGGELRVRLVETGRCRHTCVHTRRPKVRVAGTVRRLVRSPDPGLMTVAAFTVLTRCVPSTSGCW